MPLRQGRAQRCHDVAQPGLMAHQRVQVALHHHALASPGHLLPRPVQRVEVRRLVEQDRLGAVEVLGMILGRQSPPAEGDHLADGVEDREDQPVAEPVITGPVLAPADQPCREQLTVGESGLGRRGPQALPLVRRVPQAEAADRFVG